MTIAPPPPAPVDTDIGVPADTTLSHHHQVAALQHCLGRIGAAALAVQPEPDSRPGLRLVAAGAEFAHRFPRGAQTRRVDSSGQFKLFVDGVSMSNEFGWRPGGRDAVMIEGWLVVS